MLFVLFVFFLTKSFVLGEPRLVESAAQSSDEFFLEFKQIITWDEILKAFIQSIHTGEKPYKITYPGVVARAVICPKDLLCPTLNLTFQPHAVQAIGGICGLDFSPDKIDGKITRLFLLPQLPVHNNTKHSSDGPRGIIASSNGLIFDIAGGCGTCISGTYPKSINHLHNFLNPT